MNELDLQSKYLVHFLCEKTDGLRYKEVKANTVSPQLFVIEDLSYFLRETTLNRDNYRKLLRKFGNDEKDLLAALTAELSQRIRAAANMAMFLNANKSFTFEGIALHLFYPSGSETYEDQLFDQNVFSVVQELPYTFQYEGKNRFAFRPDLTFFVNGIFLGYSELKSNYSNQNARDHGRRKVARDYAQAVHTYHDLAAANDVNQTIRRDLLKIFEKAIHVTATDVQETYVVRQLGQHFDELRASITAHAYDPEAYQVRLFDTFKPYPLRDPTASKTERFEEVFRALYDKRMIEREILYYNFIERELVKKEGSSQKEYKHSDGQLISPRPKQKFGTDKIIGKIDELLAHEAEPDYFINQLRKQLLAQGIGLAQVDDLIDKRLKYQNNRHVYSLLLQYAAGFGKSNIIGWTALQLKDLRRQGRYVYDKVLLVVDRLQLRDQLDTKMHNLNIQKSMFVEADTKAALMAALAGDTRIVVVNLQKFGRVPDALAPDVLAQLATRRVAFLIDEIHRSNSGDQHEGMMNLFDELQNVFDKTAEGQAQPPRKKNLLVGFTATPSDHTLARFGEFARYAENRPIWVPFDAYTMLEAIKDGFILNPLHGLVPVSAKMYFELPDNVLEGFEGDHGYEAIPDNTDTGIDAEGKKYAIRKERIYKNRDRIAAIAKFVAERLVTSVYHNIRGTAKAMLAVSSIDAAIQYKQLLDKEYEKLVSQKKYEKYKEAPIYLVYSASNQDHLSASALNGGLSEKAVLQNFAIKKNGLLIVVDKLQTGFDEKKLHTLFLDKEIRGINAIQTISRVNRTMKYKNDCKIVDFSYKNVNIRNIKAAFEHFSNVVVSDFDPLGDEGKLAIYYDDLRQHPLFTAHFAAFARYEQGPERDAAIILALENSFAAYIQGQPQPAGELKAKINKYFHILNLIETVIVLDAKYSQPAFLKFWRKFNHEYNSLHRDEEIIDDVEIYFDNKIGIVPPADYPALTKRKPTVVSEDLAPFGTKYKFNILKVIAKRNQEEEAIEDLINEFEAKIELFFTYIRQDDTGKRLIAKMRDGGAAIDSEEIYDDFAKLYRKFVRRNKEALGDFFVKETQDILNQLCADFEKTMEAAASAG